MKLPRSALTIIGLALIGCVLFVRARSSIEFGNGPLPPYAPPTSDGTSPSDGPSPSYSQSPSYGSAQVTDAPLPSETAVICVVAKDEESYIDEFVDYHHALGFSKIFVYDNSDAFEMKQWATAKGDFIKAVHMPGKEQQMISYTMCAQEAYEQGYTWAAFFDLDEILILKKHENVVAFLLDHCEAGAVGINWFMFGTSAKEVYSPQPMTKRFVYRENGTNQHIKSIAKLSDMYRDVTNPHFVLLNDENVTTIDTSGNPIDGPFNENGPVDVAVLHHYFTKSSKEFIKKLMRGRADIKQGYEEYLVQQAHEGMVFAGDVFDETAWIKMKQYVPKYAVFDSF